MLVTQCERTSPPETLFLKSGKTLLLGGGELISRTKALGLKITNVAAPHIGQVCPTLVLHAAISGSFQHEALWVIVVSARVDRIIAWRL